MIFARKICVLITKHMFCTVHHSNIFVQCYKILKMSAVLDISKWNSSYLPVYIFHNAGKFSQGIIGRIGLGTLEVIKLHPSLLRFQTIQWFESRC